jgi:hypothetical protein
MRRCNMRRCNLPTTKPCNECNAQHKAGAPRLRSCRRHPQRYRRVLKPEGYWRALPRYSSTAQVPRRRAHAQVCFAQGWGSFLPAKSLLCLFVSAVRLLWVRRDVLPALHACERTCAAAVAGSARVPPLGAARVHHAANMNGPNHANTRTRTRTRTRTTHTRTHARTHTRTHTHMHACMRTCMHACMHVCL